MESLKDLNWNHLFYFNTVAKAQSLKAGAKEIGVSPSTLSEHIKKLEKKFDKEFFHRTTKGLMLTKSGHELYEKTKVIFEHGSKLLEHFSDNTVGGYPVNIGIVETISYDLSSEFTSQYWDLYTPYGTLNTIRQSDHDTLIENISQENIDWGISLMKPKRKGLACKEIGSFEVVFCCSKELYTKFKNHADIIVNIPFAENRLDKSLNQKVQKYFRRNKTLPKEIIYSDHFDFIKKLCTRGRCVMMIPLNPLEKYEGIKTFCLDEPMRVSLYAIWKNSHQELVSIRKLNELIQSKLSQLPERYEDVDFQIEVSEIDENLLKE